MVYNQLNLNHKRHITSTSLIYMFAAWGQVNCPVHIFVWQPSSYVCFSPPPPSTAAHYWQTNQAAKQTKTKLYVGNFATVHFVESSPS